MGYSIFDYASTEASDSATGGWNTAENQDPSTVNDGARQHKQNVANFLKDQGGTVTTGGSANAQTVTLNQAIATTVPTGFFFTVKFGYSNTSTTVTLNVNSIGAKSVKVNFGGVLSDPIPGDMRAGAYGHFIYDGTYMVLLNAQQQARYAPGTLYGLTLSNNASDATNDIDIAVGSCRSSDDSANIDLLSALTKRLDASWAVGSGNGGLDTGSVGNNTYYIWLIKRPDTGVVDALFSLSSSSPTMPTNYTLKRLIGQVTRTGGINVTPIWKGPPAVITGTFTPRFVASGATFNHTSQVGYFYKIDDMVTVTFRLDIGTTGNTLTAQPLSISGLPYLSAASPISMFYELYWQASTTTYIKMMMLLGPGSTAVAVYGLTTATTNSFSGALNSDAALHATNGSVMWGSFTYKAA